VNRGSNPCRGATPFSVRTPKRHPVDGGVRVFRAESTTQVLIAELTTRNVNVFYEIGLAHALQKPVVLVASNEPDVPFDLKHIRVIYYDVTDPSWGNKLIDKIAEKILSALKNPEEAIFKTPVET
jgi:hypothetical protein